MLHGNRERLLARGRRPRGRELRPALELSSRSVEHDVKRPSRSNPVEHDMKRPEFLLDLHLHSNREWQAEVIEALSQKDYHSLSFTPQPKIATPIATSWAASSASAASGLRPKPCQEELADVEDIAVEEPRTLSPAGRQVLAGQGPLWQNLA